MADNISSASGCTRHPSLHQLPGICPSCLRERLHQLVASPENTTYPSQRLHLIKSPSFSSSSYEYDSLPGVGPWSPPTGSRRRGQGSNRRDGSAAAEGGSLLLAVRVGGSLRKSRSIGLVGGRWDGDEGQEEEEMVKRGFWSKLIRFRSGRRSREKERWSHHHSHHHDLCGTLGDTSMY